MLVTWRVLRQKNIKAEYWKKYR